MNFYAICSALPKGQDSTSSVFFEIVKTPDFVNIQLMWLVLFVISSVLVLVDKDDYVGLW